MNRAAATIKESVQDFYFKFEVTLTKHNLKDKSSLIWNSDEFGFSHVTKPGKIIPPDELKHIYQQRTTVLPTVHGAGQTGPYLNIFKD